MAKPSKKHPVPARRKAAKSSRPDRHGVSSTALPITGNTVEKHFDTIVMAILIAFAVYQSILFFSHKVVPNLDFPGRKLLSGQLPGSFKRAPVLGIMQVALGWIVGGATPELTAGRIINAVLHPLTGLLLFLLARQVVGRTAAFVVTILTVLNPWVVWLIPEPIAQPTLLFCTVASFYLMSRRSSWCYLFASIATMTRYEGAALILSAFVLDMIVRKTTTERLKALLWAGLASLPLAAWLAGTILTWESQGATHYLKELGAASGGEFMLLETIQELYRVSFKHLFVLPEMAIKAPEVLGPGCLVRSINSYVDLPLRIVAAGLFMFGAGYGLYRRRWDILALLIFLACYVIIHALHSFVYPKFWALTHWICLLICVFGLRGLGQIIAARPALPRIVTAGARVMLGAAALVWLFSLLVPMKKMAPYSARAVWLPYVAMAAAAVFFAVRLIIDRGAHLTGRLASAAVVCLMIVCSHFTLVSVIGNGQTDVEFKLLADWYRRNAKVGEKLVTTMPHIVRIFAPEAKGCLVHTKSIGGDSGAEFIEDCYRQNISYIAWDSRLGLFPNSRYGKEYGVGRTSFLRQPRSAGPCRYLATLGSRRRFIHVFRLLKEPARD